MTTHSWDAVGSANAGVDGIEHIWSVGYSSILDLDKRRKLAEDRLAGKIDAEIAGAQYEPENYDVVIKAMVDHHVAWTPTIAKWLRPLSPSMARFRQKENEILDDPNADFPDTLRAITDSAYDKLLKRYKPEQLEATRIGYQKANEFIRRFVAAGGILKEGSDPPRGMAGMLMHEALAMDVEAGVPPMTAIQAATLNVAQDLQEGQGLRQRRAGQGRRSLDRRGRSAQGHLDDAERQDADHGRQGRRYRIPQIQESDSRVLRLPDAAARHRHLAAAR